VSRLSSAVRAMAVLLSGTPVGRPAQTSCTYKFETRNSDYYAIGM